GDHRPGGAGSARGFIARRLALRHRSLGTAGRPSDALRPVVRDHSRRAGGNRPSGSHEPGENVIGSAKDGLSNRKETPSVGWALAVSQPWHRLAESRGYGRTRKDTTKLRIQVHDDTGGPAWIA